MKRFKTIAIRLILTSALSISGGAILAQDFDKGVAAARAGDYATALKEWRPLAEQGDVDAQYRVGKIYDDGVGVLQDYAEVAKWYLLAAAQGHVEAQYNLGDMYHKGLGVVQDDAETLKWYRLAAEQGYTRAQFMIGLMYERIGYGVLPDNMRAHMWYNIAAANGEDILAPNHRDGVAREMSSEDISQAVEMARECMNSGYESCGW